MNTLNQISLASNLANQSATVSVIANRKTWLESSAVEQLKYCASLPQMIAVAGMPDLHPGRSYPIGAVCFSVGRIYPALVGNDIGCGMGIWQTELLTTKFHQSKIVKQLSDLDRQLTQQEQMDLLTGDKSALATWQVLSANASHMQSLGTIGRGNHFVELQKVEKVYDEATFERYGFSKRFVQILVHSGSRGLGESILREHVEQFSHAGINTGSEDAEHYLIRHQHALDYAELNRLLISLRIQQKIKSSAVKLLDCSHNFVEKAEIAGKTGFLHRKGATPSTQGLVVIPGSRGDYSYLVEPISTEASLYSLAHGAGRKWQRSYCKGLLRNKYHYDQLTKTQLGSYVICRDRELMYEEAPEAYKSISTVIDSLQEAGLINVVARLAPLITYKTEGRCC